MNIKVDRHLFLSELYYLQGMVGGKQLIPILSHLYIDARPGKILMRATDLNITITTECEAKVRDVGAVCLPARKLMEIVKSLPQGEIEIQADSSCHATITCQRSRFKLLGTKGEHFPELRQFSGEFSEVPAEIFARFIPVSFTLLARNTEKTHSGLQRGLSQRRLQCSRRRPNLV
jgi:DNA polymerase III subunit beta